MENIDIGKVYLFFGCRGNYDALFKDQLKQLKKSKVLSGLFIAYSRKPNHPKTYVNDLIEQNPKIVSKVCRRGYVYICGSTGLSNNVNSSIENIIGSKKYSKLLNNNRIVIDCWG